MNVSLSHRPAKSNRRAFPRIENATRRRTIRRLFRQLNAAMLAEAEAANSYNSCPDDEELQDKAQHAYVSAVNRALYAQRNVIRAILSAFGLADSPGHGPILGFSGPPCFMRHGDTMYIVTPSLDEEGDIDSRLEPSLTVIECGNTLAL